MKRFLLYSSMLAMALIFVSCEKNTGNGDGQEGNEKGEATSLSVSGFAQKGQLIKGASVTAFGLDKKLTATGASYPTSIKDDMGSFSLNANSDADYLEFRAEGYYFNENTGVVSEAPIYLQALAEKSEKGVNINLLTTLTSARIKRLVKEGKTFSEAKAQAQEELLKSLDINKEIAKVGFETLNIAKGSDADAALLAVSLLLQRGRSTGDLLAKVAEMSSEFESSGKLSDKTLGGIFLDTKNFPVGSVLDNLIAYYKSKGIKEYAIPPFYKYVDEVFNQDFFITEESSLPTDYLSSDSWSGEFKLVAHTDFSCSPDVDWIEAVTTKLADNYWLVKYTLKPNSGSKREGNLLIKDKSGILKKSVSIKQDSGLQVIHVYENDNTRALLRSVSAGDKVSVNGKVYTLSEDQTVEVEKAESYYVGYPESVTGLIDNPYYCTVKFPSETYEIDDEGTRVPSVKIPKFAAITTDMYGGGAIPKYAEASLIPCVACLKFTFKKLTSIAYIVVEANSDALLSGTATYKYDSETINPETSNQSNRVKVYNPDGDNSVNFVTMAQTLTQIKVSAYDSNDVLLQEKSASVTLTLKNGKGFEIKIGN